MKPGESLVGSSDTMTVVCEPEFGGRLSSLRSPGNREWLWRCEEVLAARSAIQPGDAFVDAGGLEECFPTIAGTYDHGDVWSRHWSVDGETMAVDGEDYRLERRIEIAGETLTLSYRLSAQPAFRFVWTAHTSLELSRHARILAPSGTSTRMWPEHWRTYPTFDRLEGAWPAPLGRPLDRLEIDGTAEFFMLLGLPEITVDHGEKLTFRLEVDKQPIAMAVWRNLGAWPAQNPYRSIAIEPAIGWHFDWELAAPGEVGVMPETGSLEWRLIIETASQE